ncbi:MAG: hypothetical protein HUU37_04685 [Bdellovibrionales bacterium]|nr:hypothetical protein [Bdellovibrionales bacterium]
MDKTRARLLLAALLAAAPALAAEQKKTPYKPLPPVKITDFAEARAGSSPDNSFKTVTEAIENARESIRLAGYMLRSLPISDRLEAAARRGVRVRVLLDGWTVGRPRSSPIDDQELYNAARIVRAGGAVSYLKSEKIRREDRRFVYLHAKYLVIDDRSVVISSENFANGGFSPTSTLGSRGWVIHLTQPELAQSYAEAFDRDAKPTPGYDDLAPYGTPPYKLTDKDFVPEQKAEEGGYEPVSSRHVRGEMTLERILSPDDAAAGNRSVIGAMDKARSTLFIQSLSFQPHWGPEESSPLQDPSPYAEAVLRAARRGVKVRVMLQPPFFARSPKTPPNDGMIPNFLLSSDLPEAAEAFASGGFARSAWRELVAAAGDDDDEKRKLSTKDNRALIEYFRRTARAENLDLQVNFFWVDDGALKLLHNKGMVVDAEKVLVSSINWTKNSILNNREAAVLVTHREVADYYEDLFQRDWQKSRNSR